MHIVVDRADLVRVITSARATVPGRSTIPILSNVKILAADGYIGVTGTDLERQCMDRSSAEIVTAGGITVPADVLISVAKALPSGRVTLATEADAGRLTVTSGRSRYRISTLPADDYPDIGGTEAGVDITLPAAIVRRLIGDTIVAASTDDARPYLGGCLLHTPSGTRLLRAVATDGHRMMVTETALPDLAQPIPAPGIIVPRQAQSDIGRMTDGGEGDVRLVVTGTRLRVEIGSIAYATKLIDGTYPDYERVTPQHDVPHAATVSRSDLEDATARVLAVLDPKLPTIRIGWSGATSDDGVAGEIEMSSRRGSDHEAIDAIAATIEGGPFESGISARYLLDQLGVMRGDRVTIAIAEPGSPLRLIDHGHETDVHVIMPMRL